MTYFCRCFLFTALCTSRGRNCCKQCGGFRILILPIPDPGSRIPDPKIVTKERGEKNLLSYFFCSHKIHKIEYYVIFEMLKKKIWANFQRIVEVFTQKIFNMLSNIWVWDPGSGIRDPGSEIRDPEKIYSGSRIQGSKRHRIPDPDPQHWLQNFFYKFYSDSLLKVHLCLIYDDLSSMPHHCSSGKGHPPVTGQRIEPSEAVFLNC